LQSCFASAEYFTGDVWSRNAAAEPNQGLPPQMECYRLLCNVSGGGSIGSSAHRIAAIHCSPLITLRVSPTATQLSILAAADTSGCVALAFISSLPTTPSSCEADGDHASLVRTGHPVLATAVSRHVMLERHRISHVKCFQESSSTLSTLSLASSPDFDCKFVMVAASFEGTPPNSRNITIHIVIVKPKRKISTAPYC
jgi:hypothetical protein